MPGPVIPIGMTWVFPQLLPHRSPKRPITPQRRGEVGTGGLAQESSTHVCIPRRRPESDRGSPRGSASHLPPFYLHAGSRRVSGHARLVPDRGSADAKILVESMVRFWPVPRRHRTGTAGPGMGERCFGHRQPCPSCRELPAPQRGADAGLFLILNEIKSWNCF